MSRRLHIVRNFLDLVRNPAKFYAEWARQDAELDFAVPADPSEAEIEKQVARLLKPAKVELAFEWLKRVGDKTVPALTRVFDDPRYRVKPAGEYADPPLAYAIRALGDIGSPEAVPFLKPLLRDDEKRLRELAAYELGYIGHPLCVAAVSKGIGGTDGQVRFEALLGITSAIRDGRTHRQFLTDLFPVLEPLLVDSGVTVPSSAAEIMLAGDRERATQIIFSERVLSADNPALFHVLIPTLDADVAVPCDRLSRLADELKGGGEDKEQAYGSVLRLLAKARAEGVEARIREAMQSESGTVLSAAAESLALYYGVRDAVGFCIHRKKQVGWEGLTEPQRVLDAVAWLEMEVNNGGFAQYFFNSAGDHCRDARRGLEILGAVRTEGLLRQAMGLFWPDGPPRDQTARRERLSRLINKDPDAFSDLDSRFFEDADHLFVLQMKYAAHHADHFGGEAGSFAARSPSS
jgi:HEAT repeat protein